VQLKDAAGQLIITPRLKEMPEVQARGKKIILKFKQPLDENTTYRLFFGNAIADMHEGNVLNDFEYVFSTGNVIDSLSLKGIVLNAFTLIPEKGITIGLYDLTENDSVIFKKPPLYFTRTNAGGSYKLSFLPGAKFRGYAFLDKNKNMMYDGGEEIAGFKDKDIETLTDSILDFKVFYEESSKKFIKRKYSPYHGVAYVIYNKELYNSAEPLDRSLKSKIVSEREKNDTCKVFYHSVYDTLTLKVAHELVAETDTVRITILGKELAEKQMEKQELGVIIEPLENGKVAFFQKPVLTFMNWLDTGKTDNSRIKLVSKSDSLIDSKPLLSSIGLDKLVLNNKLKPGCDYTLILKKGAFRGMTGIENDSVKLGFKTSLPEDYGHLNLRIYFPGKENYIVQLVNSQQKPIATQFVSLSLTSSAEQVFQFKNLSPGQYYAKVIEDVNNNKIWDTGGIITRKQAEKIYFNAQAIKLMADWEAESEWKIKAD